MKVDNAWRSDMMRLVTVCLATTPNDNTLILNHIRKFLTTAIELSLVSLENTLTMPDARKLMAELLTGSHCNQMQNLLCDYLSR
jgi:hypothetical protein